MSVSMGMGMGIGVSVVIGRDMSMAISMSMSTGMGVGMDMRTVSRGHGGQDGCMVVWEGRPVGAAGGLRVMAAQGSALV